MRAETMEQALVARGYRLTDSRRALIAVIAAWPGWFSSRELCRSLQRKKVSVGRATVFRTLNLLVELGLVERVRARDDSEGYVVTCGGDHHHHLVCVRCGRVEELPECPVKERLAELAAARNFRVESHSLEVFGICGDCADTDDTHK